MNIHKKVLLALIAALSIMPLMHSFLPCGDTVPGVLRVGIVPENLPWSDIDSFGNAIGFDPELVQAVAGLLGYETVQFVGFADAFDAQAALTAGTINIYANSGQLLSIPPVNFIGIVTDISGIASGSLNGWIFNTACCRLARQVELAINQLVANGRYAQILQILRLNNLTNGLNLGLPTSATGVLQEPFPFASSEAGTIPTTCITAGPVSLPELNCISAFLQNGCSISTTFTGATGLTPA